MVCQGCVLNPVIIIPITAASADIVAVLFTPAILIITTDTGAAKYTLFMSKIISINRQGFINVIMILMG